MTAAAGIAYWDGRTAEAMRLYAEELDLARALADPAAEADALFNLTTAWFVSGDIDGANAMVDTTIAKFQAIGDVRGLARLQWGRGTILLQNGDPVGAEAVFREGLEEFERIGDAWYHAMSLGSVAWANYQQGKVREAGAWLARGFAETYALMDISSSVIALPGFAVIAIEAGRFEDAAALLGAVEAFRLQYGITTPGGFVQLVSRGNPFERIPAALSPEQFAAATERGRRMTLAEAANLIGSIAEPFIRDQ